MKVNKWKCAIQYSYVPERHVPIKSATKHLEGTLFNPIWQMINFLSYGCLMGLIYVHSRRLLGDFITVCRYGYSYITLASVLDLKLYFQINELIKLTLEYMKIRGN